MASHQISNSNEVEPRPWKRIAGQELQSRAAQPATSNISTATLPPRGWLRHIVSQLTLAISKLFIGVVHRIAKSVNKPVIDIGREYSVSALNERINTLEEILVRQWSQFKDEDFLTAHDEIKQYIAACHVARQYDRITAPLLSSRLGIRQAKAEQLIDRLMEDEVITESYTVTYHDVRRTMVDATIERQLQSMRNVAPSEAANQNLIKKH